MFIQKNYMKQRQLFIHANIFISDDWAVIVPNLAGAPYKTKRRQLSKPEKKSKLRNTHSKDVINTIKFIFTFILTFRRTKQILIK